MYKTACKLATGTCVKSSWDLQVAAGLMSGALTGVFCAARLMLFVGGPSTCGGGMIVNTELSDAIRSHKVSALVS